MPGSSPPLHRSCLATTASVMVGPPKRAASFRSGTPEDGVADRGSHDAERSGERSPDRGQAGLLREVVPLRSLDPGLLHGLRRTPIDRIAGRIRTWGFPARCSLLLQELYRKGLAVRTGTAVRTMENSGVSPATRPRGARSADPRHDERDAGTRALEPHSSVPASVGSEISSGGRRAGHGKTPAEVAGVASTPKDQTGTAIQGWPHHLLPRRCRGARARGDAYNLGRVALHARTDSTCPPVWETASLRQRVEDPLRSAGAAGSGKSRPTDAHASQRQQRGHDGQVARRSWCRH